MSPMHSELQNLLWLVPVRQSYHRQAINLEYMGPLAAQFHCQNALQFCTTYVYV